MASGFGRLFFPRALCATYHRRQADPCQRMRFTVVMVTTEAVARDLTELITGAVMRTRDARRKKISRRLPGRQKEGVREGRYFLPPKTERAMSNGPRVSRVMADIVCSAATGCSTGRVAAAINCSRSARCASRAATASSRSFNSAC